MDEARLHRRNLWMYPLGTVGRDMMYTLFTNYILTFILFTRSLTTAQLGAITAIMVGARVFDALNDPFMGNIIERTRTRWGKFKPWLVIGIVSTCAVVYAAFNNKLEGWSFIWFFGLIYFLYSITYTMHDISYWGMVSALSSNADARNQFTSRATLFAGIGGTIAAMLIPMFTTGDMTIGGNAAYAYGKIALAVCLIAPLFLTFTVVGARERRDDLGREAPPVSFKKIIGTITGNDQLLWISLAFLIQQVGNGIVLGGLGSTYIYFDFGYEGGLYSTFQTVGLMATAVLMVFYPAISRKLHRKRLMKIMAIAAVIGYAVMVAAGLLLPAATLKFWILTAGFMFANFGQYGFYLVMMISIINTVEYNEYKVGTRDEAIITSLRPFLTKMGSAIVVIVTTASYTLFHVLDRTNQISDFERAASGGSLSEAEKLRGISEVIQGVQPGQCLGLLLSMTVLPCALLLISYFIYKKRYKLDEEEYDRICAEIEARKAEMA